MDFISNIRGKISHIVDVIYNKYYPPQILFRNRQRKRLQNREFSLLTGNCVGGYLYHQLGLQFTSPTINLMILNQDFKKMILNLKYYMSLTPVVYHDPSFPNVPSAIIDDVIIHFTHYDTADEGIRAWEKRKGRINYDNLYIIISDIDLSENDIIDLQSAECKKIVVMTSKNYNYEHCLFLPAYQGQKHVGELLRKTIAGKWQFEHFFDFVGWVNSDVKSAKEYYIGE